MYFKYPSRPVFTIEYLNDMLYYSCVLNKYDLSVGKYMI